MISIELSITCKTSAMYNLCELCIKTLQTLREHTCNFFSITH